MPKRSTLRLTTRSIGALPVTGKDAVFWDRDLAGFGVCPALTAARCSGVDLKSRFLFISLYRCQVQYVIPLF